MTEKSNGRNTPARANSEEKEPTSADQLTDEALLSALVNGEHRHLLEPYFGEEAYTELAALAGRARARPSRGGPKVILLPGIMGSRLGKKRPFLWDDIIWVDLFDAARGCLPELSLATGDPEIEPLGMIQLAYLKMKLFLKRAGYEVITHPYDWRKDLEELGSALASRIRRETSGGKRVSLVCHSMGGLLARVALAGLGPEDSSVDRVIQMGTPNHGSFSPVQALRGDHGLVGAMAALDLVHSEAALIETFSTFHGLIQMMPFRDRFAGVDHLDPESWPAGHRLKRNTLSHAAKVQERLPPPDDRFCLIAGTNKETVVGLELVDGEAEYLISRDGDGTVPHESSHHAAIEEVYYVEVSHGSLPNSDTVCHAVNALLKGQRPDLADERPRYRDPRKRVPADNMVRKVFDGRRGRQISAAERRNALADFAAPPKREATEPQQAGRPPSAHAISGEPIIIGRKRQNRLELQLAHGSITECDAHTLVLGLFRDVEPAGAAVAIDARLEGTISELRDRRMFNGHTGEIFILPTGRYPITAATILFAGLGPFDDFDEDVIALVAENVTRTLMRTKVDSFGTVLIGAGSGVLVADALAASLQGFNNGIGAVMKQSRVPTITLCEMDDTRYAEIRGDILRLATTALFDEVELTVEEVDLPEPPRNVVRAVEKKKTEPVYLTVRKIIHPDADPIETSGTDPEHQEETVIQASLLTVGGKATVITDTATVVNSDLTSLLEKVEMSNFTLNKLPGFGTELAEMVLPADIRTALSGLKGKRTVVIHDAWSSRIPWETICIEDRFPALEDGMSRKYTTADLSVAKWLESRRRDGILEILVVIDPTRDLPGAAEEGEALVEALAGISRVETTVLRGREAGWTALSEAFRSGDYDAVHYAGHAYFDRGDHAKSGIVCADHRVLSGADLAGMSHLPALVFFNACEAARIRGKKKRMGGRAARDRIERNVSLAEAFLRGGIANYVGTYWPVGDAGAKTFAEVFYAGLLKGAPIGEALLEGRKAVREKGNVDWADYIHYGGYGFCLEHTDAV